MAQFGCKPCLRGCVGSTVSADGRGFPAQVLGLYTADDAILRVGAGYFRIVAFSYLPMAVSTVLSAWLRCKEHAAVPFWASFGAVAASAGLNYLLIFGKLGAPTMGVTGAAITTLVSQLLNLLLILIGFAVCLQRKRNARSPWRFGHGGRAFYVYFPSTTESLISFSVSLRSRAPPSATVTRSS